MRVVVAPDSYKDALGAREAARAMSAGIRAADPSIEVTEIPQGDGGEGSLDSQSLAGKTPIGAARVAQRLGVPCLALVGRLGPDWQKSHQQGITAAFALAEGPGSLSDALPLTAARLKSRSEELMRLWLAALRAGQ